jgi:nicotinate-nucleotide pyrophosphorylase (carboxylating)
MDATLAFPDIMIEPLVRAALLEDLGRAGDIATDAIIPATMTAEAAIVAREAGTTAGVRTAELAFRVLSPELDFPQSDRAGAVGRPEMMSVSLPHDGLLGELLPPFAGSGAVRVDAQA